MVMTAGGDLLADLADRSPLPALIDGEWRVSDGGSTGPVIDPSTGEQIATVALAGAAEVDAAVAAARRAFPGWAATPGAERARLLRALGAALTARSAELGALEALDVGKPIGQAVGWDIPFALGAYDYFAGLAEGDAGAEELPADGIAAERVLRPRGVCAFIFPWNAPFLLTTWGIAPALAAGNTVVVKASELTPLTTLEIAATAMKVGFPPGVINIVPGVGDVAGAALVAHPDINMISFTGSPRVGRQIAQIAGAALIPTKLELGGKGAAVVFPDVDVASAAGQLAFAVTLNAGQVCCTATRWLVHEDVFDDLVDAASAAMSALRIGPASDPETELGPVTSAVQRDRVLGYLEKGAAQGGRMLLAGGAATVSGHPGGYYVRPAIVTGEIDNVCAREEIFGPVAFVAPFRTEAEAIEMVNSSPYGLANSVWSDDVSRAHRVAASLVAGTTWLNAHNVFAYGVPYGGVNQSGWGGGINAASTYRDYLRAQVIARSA
jgi:aldehyde dehydrogenase (NAD+)